MAKSLETDINSSSSSSENDENDSDDDLDDVSKDNDGGKKGIDDDNDDGNKGNNAGSKGIEDDNDGADDLNKEVSNMINSTSTMSLVDYSGSEFLTQPLPPDLPNSSTKKSEYFQIMKALTNLSEAVGILSKDLQKIDQNSEIAPIVRF